jgi:hypothetical protein
VAAQLAASQEGISSVSKYVKFYVFRAVTVKITVFWDIRPCSLVECNHVPEKPAASHLVLEGPPAAVFSIERCSYFSSLKMEAAGSSERLGTFYQWHLVTSAGESNLTYRK